MAIGVVWLRRRGTIVGDSASLGWLAALVAAVAAIYWAYGLGGGAHLGVEGSWLATLASLAVILLALVCGGRFPAGLVASAPLLFVGRVSYSGYLYHLPLLHLWNRFHLLEASVLSLPVFLLTLLAIASLSYHYVESPFMRRL